MGNIISSALIVGLYVLFQAIQLWRKGVEPRALWMLLLQVGGFALLGVALSIYRLGPAVVYRDSLVRSAEAGNLQYMTLGLEHYPALFLTNLLVPGEVSMTSFYMTLPALLLLTYLPLRWLKEKWPIAAVTLIALCSGGRPVILRLVSPRQAGAHLCALALPLQRLPRLPDHRPDLLRHAGGQILDRARDPLAEFRWCAPASPQPGSRRASI